MRKPTRICEKTSSMSSLYYMVTGPVKFICCAGIEVISQESIYSLHPLFLRWTIYTRNVGLDTHRSQLLGTCVLDVCDDGWGDCLRLAVLKPTVLHLCYTNLWAYTIHPLLQHIGTTGKGYSTAQMTVLYFVMKVMFLCMLHTQGHCLQLHSKINVCIVH